ncbi:type II secretion system protein [Candidatus Saccharibacteria bacterium]|nr:type II secretion system protein [Candidatus Saccharibacteria bacterium]
MLKNHTKAKSGFTIIEVVLVLAIAGLIFLMVFLALPALQRSQRDTQRRDDLSGLSTRITDYQSNNRGKVPSDTKWADFLRKYMKQSGDDSIKNTGSEEWTEKMNEGEFVDPDGSAYGIKVESGNSGTLNSDFKENNHLIHVYYGAKCGDDESVVPATGGSSRQIAFLYPLEGGGVYCGSNS